MEDMHALASIGQQPIYLAKSQLSSQLSTTQISIKSTAFYPYVGRKINGNRSQSRDKMLQILPSFVLCPAMLVANHQLDRLANGQCWQVHVFHIVSLPFIAVIDPTPLFKFIIFKLFLYVYFYGLAIAIVSYFLRIFVQLNFIATVWEEIIY